MKTLYLIRHAKSKWKGMDDVADINRPLNNRGNRDAPFMGNLLRARSVKPDAMISSPAVRAHTTALYFARAMGMSESFVQIDNRIYPAGAGDMLMLFRQWSDDWDTVLVFGHNPTFTSLVNLWTDDYLTNLPTCGIVRVDFEIDHWSELDETNGEVIQYHYPKQFFPKD